MAPDELRAQLAARGSLSLDVHAIPKSRKSEWAGPRGDGSWKVKLAAVPDKGRANEELVRFLAEEFGVSRRNVEITAGAASHNKRVRITTL